MAALRTGPKAGPMSWKPWQLVEQPRMGGIGDAVVVAQHVGLVRDLGPAPSR